MYEIFSDNVLLYAPYLKAEDKKILNPKWVMELGKAGELTFIAPPESPLYLGQNTNDGETRYNKLTSTIWIRKTFHNNTKIIWSGRVLHDYKDFNGNKDVYCEGRLAYLNDGICFPYRFGYPKRPAYIDITRYRAGGVFPASYAAPDSEGHPGAGLIPNYIRLFNVHQQENKRFKIGTLNVVPLDQDPDNTFGYSFGSDEFNSFYDEMTEKLINDSNFGGYFSVSYDGTTIDTLVAYFNYLHYEDGSNDNAPHSNQVIRFGENLLDISEYVDTENIFTIITPLGKSTINYIYKRDESIVNVINENNKKATLWAWLVNNHSSVAATYKSSPSASSPPENDDFINNEFPKSETGPRIDISSINRDGDGNTYKYTPRPDQWNSNNYNVKKYGSIERTITFDDIEDPNKLLELGRIYLGLIGLIDTISITAADLSAIDVNVDEIELGDIVTIESVPHGISAKLQCRKIELDFENPMSTVFTFGSTVSGLTDKQLDNAKQTMRNKEQINSTSAIVNRINAIDSDGQTLYAKKSELLSLQNATNARLEAISELPTVTNADNGKILQVVNGTWQLVVNSGGGSTSRLPSEYQEVTWIKSSGTQYIDTGINAESGTSCDISFQMVSVPPDASVLAARTSSVRMYLVHIYPSSFCLGYGSYYSGSSVQADTDYQVAASLNNGDQSMSVNGTVDISKNITGDQNINLNYYLFGLNNNGSINSRTSLKLYYCKLYSNNTLVRDFVPCYIKNTSEVGLYDLVSQTFFHNSGTGTFTSGPNV